MKKKMTFDEVCRLCDEIYSANSPVILTLGETSIDLDEAKTWDAEKLFEHHACRGDNGSITVASVYIEEVLGDGWRSTH